MPKSQPYPQLGSEALTYELLLVRERWRHRIVQQCTPLDDFRMQYRISADFTVPPQVAPTRPSAKKTEVDRDQSPAVDQAPEPLELYVPLAFVQKRLLGDLDVRDEHDHALPALNLEHEQFLTEVLLTRHWLHHRTKGPIGGSRDELREKLRSLIACQVPERAEAILSELRTTPAWAAMAKPDQETFARSLRSLTTESMLFAHLPSATPGQRRVIKLSYTDEFPQAPSRRGHLARLNPLRILRFIRFARFLRWLGLYPTALVFSIPVDHAASFHLEVTAPTGLAFVDGFLRQRGQPVRDEGVPAGAPVAHLYVGPEHDGNDPIEARLLLLPERGGWTNVAIVTAVFVAAAVTFAARHINELLMYHNAVPASGVLPAVGAVAVVYLARPFEHRLTSRLLAGARTLLVGIGAAAAATTAGLLLVPPPSLSTDPKSPPGTLISNGIGPWAPYRCWVVYAVWTLASVLLLGRLLWPVYSHARRIRRAAGARFAWLGQKVSGDVA